MSALTIGLSLSPTWLRGDAWRRADSRVEEMYSLEFSLRAAELAEQAHLDFVFKPDALTLDPQGLAGGAGFSGLDPFVLMSALAARTERIGLIPTVSASYSSPFAVARQLASLDRISRGRAGWNVVTSLGGRENFGELTAPADPYANASDFVRVVEELRQSFPAEALRFDRDGGAFADPALVRRIGAVGRYSSAGPLTTPALSREPLPMLHAGGSPASELFAIAHADGVFTMSPDAGSAAALRDRLRSPRSPRVLPGLALCLAASRAEAEDLAAGSGSGDGRGARHWTIVGTPDDAVAEILDWHRAGAIDGLIALPMASWGSLELFLREVVPALAAQGAFRTDYTGTTLREHLEDGRG